MTDPKTLADQNETPEDVATLYSWANLHGAKYRDFSASRAQTREKARLRVQEAIEEERRRAQEEAEANAALESMRAAEAKRAADAAARHAELAAQAAAEQAAQLARQQAAQRAAQQVAAWQQPAPEPYPVRQPAPLPPLPPIQPMQPMPAAPPQYYPLAAPQPELPAYAPPQPPPQPQAYRPAAPQTQYPAPPPQYPAVREENYPQPRSPWAAQPEPRETMGRPAWLAADHPEIAPQPVFRAPEDTLQGSRDRLTSRWFALKGVFNGAPAQEEAPPLPAPSRIPVLAVFSLAGGVGKTSVVATLGRALSGRGERVLLVDTTPYGLLPFFFGARDQRPGQLRTFTPPGSSGDAPIQMVTIDAEALVPDTPAQEPVSIEIGRYSHGMSRILIDLATASGATTRRVLKMSPTILVPVVPDMNSVVSVGSIDAFFKHNTKQGAKPAQTYYILNQFDPSMPLHLDVREVLREQLGDRLLPFALRRAPAVSEALAEGMTVMDYAPNSTVAEDFGSLAGWVKSLAAPATTGYRGVRWSER